MSNQNGFNSPQRSTQRRADEEPILFDTRSEEAQEIIGRMPSWIVKWGIVVFSMILGVILLIAGIVRYPEVISASVVLTPNNPPVLVLPQNEGSIQQINVTNSERVKNGQLLAVLKNSARYEDVVIFKDLLTQVDTTLYLKNFILSLNFPGELQLGPLKASYSRFIRSIKRLRELNNNLSLENENEFRTKITYFLEEVNTWEASCLVRSPASGRVMFLDSLQLGISVNAERPLMVIVQDQQLAPSIIGNVPVKERHKLQTGQKIDLEIASYPSGTFGKLKGEVGKIWPPVLSDKCFFEIKLSDGLRTNRKVNITIESESVAMGEITIEDETILRKLLTGILNI